jgi:ketosteroid isomerase-like protein
MNAVDVVRRYLAAFASGDPDVVAACVRDEYRRRLPGFLSTFAGARYSIVDVGALDRADGVEAVVARYRFEAEYERTPIDIPGVMWFEVREGLVARRTDLWDSLTFLRQTGQAD